MKPILLRGRLGLGDQIYQRAVVRSILDRLDVYLETPFPQLVGDLPIKCVRRPTTLRTQAKNAARAQVTWYTAPRGLAPLVIGYAGRAGTVLQGFCDTLGVKVDQCTFDLPSFGPHVRRRPYVVIRPATIRREWPRAARNPLPEYLALAASILRRRFDVVSVADLAHNHEWALPPLPYADQAYHAGELTVENLMALISGASGVVAGVGWAVPAAVAYRVPLFVIYGGCGAHDGPARIFDPRMPTGSVHHAIPDNFCQCANRSHSCDKRIATIEQQLEQWALGLVALRPFSMVA